MVNRRISKDLRKGQTPFLRLGTMPPLLPTSLPGDSVNKWIRNVGTYGAIQPLRGRKQILSTHIIEETHDLLRSSVLYLDEIVS